MEHFAHQTKLIVTLLLTLLATGVPRLSARGLSRGAYRVPSWGHGATGVGLAWASHSSQSAHHSSASSRGSSSSAAAQQSSLDYSRLPVHNPAFDAPASSYSSMFPLGSGGLALPAYGRANNYYKSIVRQQDDELDYRTGTTYDDAEDAPPARFMEAFDEYEPIAEESVKVMATISDTYPTIDAGAAERRDDRHLMNSQWFNDADGLI